MLKTQKEKRESQRLNYLEGRARRPYRRSAALNSSLTEESSASATRLAGVCNECYPILSWYADTFRGLTHQGSDLIRRKSIHPNPKRTDFTHYRDVKKQTDWLRQNVFDSMGNYLYCGVCVRSALGIGRQRIARQCQIKRLQSQQPLSQLTKTDVEEKHLAEFIVMPNGTETTFKTWWKTITPTQLVSIRVPHSRDGNAGKTSNSAKTTVMQDFLQFIDVNSQPNGRSQGSSGPTAYFQSLIQYRHRIWVPETMRNMQNAP